MVIMVIMVIRVLQVLRIIISITWVITLAGLYVNKGKWGFECCMDYKGYKGYKVIIDNWVRVIGLIGLVG
jgi:hypothetical protein